MDEAAALLLQHIPPLFIIDYSNLLVDELFGSTGGTGGTAAQGHVGRRGATGRGALAAGRTAASAALGNNKKDDLILNKFSSIHIFAASNSLLEESHQNFKLLGLMKGISIGKSIFLVPLGNSLMLA